MSEEIDNVITMLRSEIADLRGEIDALKAFPPIPGEVKNALSNLKDDNNQEADEGSAPDGLSYDIPVQYNDQIGVDNAAAPDYLGAAYNDGVLRLGIESVAAPVTTAVEQAGLRWQDAGNHCNIAHQDAPGTGPNAKSASSNNAVTAVNVDGFGHVYDVTSGQPWKADPSDPVYPTVQTLFETGVDSGVFTGTENDLDPGAVWYGVLSINAGQITLTNYQMCMPI